MGIPLLLLVEMQWVFFLGPLRIIRSERSGWECCWRIQLLIKQRQLKSDRR